MTQIFPPRIAELIEQFKEVAIINDEWHQYCALVIWRELTTHLTQFQLMMIGVEWSRFTGGIKDQTAFIRSLDFLIKRYRTI